MGTALGTLSKVAFRAESDRGMVNAGYPQYTDTTSPHADEEEVTLGGSDLVPFTSEGLEEEHQFEVEESLTGVAGINSSDRVAILGGGTLEVQGMYDGLDALIACAMGFELPDATDSPADQNAQALTEAGGFSQSSTWEDATYSFVSGDIGKFIRITGATMEGQVRRITAVSDDTATITSDWDVAPDSCSGKMAQEFLHLFELSNNLQDEKWTDVYASYPTGGVGTANDQILRRGTLGVEKSQTKPWIWRSCMVNSMTISFSTTGVSFSFELIPFDLDRDSATNTASTTWGFDYDSGLFQENERMVFPDLQYFRLDSYSDSVSLSSADNIGINEFSITINNNLKADDQDAVTGAYRVEPSRGGFREITGSFSLPRYDADTIVDWHANKTTLMGHLKFQGSTIASSARYFELFLSSLEITGKSMPISGADVVNQSFDFRCLVPAGQPSGFPTQNLTAPRSEIMIRTLNQNPYNIFRDQNKEY